ncbi:hypothetical protein HDV01_006063 [Terramyces sp. JEL0728]|nr:hypothetical protein HDV01_006063 [Terramyces sp. JEL0728]
MILPPPPPNMPMVNTAPAKPIVRDSQDRQQEKTLLQLDVHSFLQPVSKLLAKSNSMIFTAQEMKDIFSLHKQLVYSYEYWKEYGHEFDRIIHILEDLKSKLSAESVDVKELDDEAYIAKFKIGPQYMKMLKSIMKTPDFLQELVSCYFKYNTNKPLKVVQLIDWVLSVCKNPDDYGRITLQAVDNIVHAMGGIELFNENMIAHFKNFYKTDTVPDYLIQSKSEYIAVEDLVRRHFGSFRTMWKFACTVQYCESKDVYPDAISFLYIYTKFTDFEWNYICSEDWYTPAVKSDFEAGKKYATQTFGESFSHLTKGQQLLSTISDLNLHSVSLAFVNYYSTTNQIGFGNIYLQDLGDFTSTLKDSNVHFIVSFGGQSQNNPEIANVCDSVDCTVKAYQQVIDITKATALDFDLEYNYAGNELETTRRFQAINCLRTNNPKLYVSLTTKVDETGLSRDSINFLKSALAEKTVLDNVNIMAMDYGSANVHGDFGKVVIQSSQGAYKQLQSMGFNQTKLGIIAMIGTNDDGNIFTLKDAQGVVDWAKTNQFVSLLSFWALGRDNGPSGTLYTSTLVQQAPFDYSKIFRQFDSPDMTGNSTDPNSGAALPNAVFTLFSSWLFLLLLL